MTSFAETELTREAARLDRFAPPPLGESAEVTELCRRALRQPVGGLDLEREGEQARRIVVVLSDGTRDDPRHALLTALCGVLPWERVELMIASGTHAPGHPDLIPEAFRDRPIHVFDAASPLVDLGRTSLGTRVRVSRVLAEADLVVATGRIRPHYFAGLSGGAKAVFPGCAHPEDALQNHLLKAHPTARLGRVDDNLCRLDMEEAVGLLPSRVGILNVLADVDGAAVAAASGHFVVAHRQLASRALECFTVRVPRCPVVVVADQPPVSRTLYQASKLLPPAGPVLEEGGTVILVADCSDGVGPQPRVNEGIYALGVRPQLPTAHRVVLVSTLGSREVLTTYASPAPSLGAALDEALARHGVSRAVAIWRAGEAISRALLP